MLDRRSWWPAAENLTVGQKKRVPHDCGEGRTLIVSRDANGYRAWCHRCNDGGGAPPPSESLGEKVARLARQQAGDLEASVSHSGPLPAVRRCADWPAGAQLWLYRAGLSSADIGRLGIYYHPPSDRVILPVVVGGESIYWQGRAYQKDRMPKYLGPTPRPSRLLPCWGKAQVPTLCEDMLSAMKLGTVAEGWAVLGTRVSDHMLAVLMKRGGGCNVWLDPDAAGRRGAAKIMKQLRAYGVPCRDILSTRDPKLHTRDEIKEILWNK